MVVAITYGDEQYRKSIKLNMFTARVIGKADKTISYSRRDIDELFYQKNRRILDQKRGGGYWLWKPYVILKTLKQLKYGDYLMYSDSGTIYVNRIKKLILALKKNHEDILISSSVMPHEDWCKKECIERMNVRIEEKTHQIEAGYILIRKTPESVKFIAEWLENMQDYNNVSDVTKECLTYERKGFKEHRHDQAVLTNLCIKWGIKPYKGLSGRSEYKYYVKYKDNEFWGYSKKELLGFCLDEKKSGVFEKSDYGRIFINTNIDTTNNIMFFAKLLSRILKALLTDTLYALRANKIMKIYK